MSKKKALNRELDYHEIPDSVMNRWARTCNCCPICNQQIPCDGVMAGGLCDDLCDCDYYYEMQYSEDWGN